MFRKSLLIVLLLASGSAALDEENVSLTETNGIYLLSASFEVKAPVREVWDALIDYEHLGGVLSLLKASRIVSRQGNRVELRQTFSSGFLIFQKTFTLLLSVVELPFTNIHFEEISGKPFPVYRGSWVLEKEGDSVRVLYALRISRGRLAPAFIERSIFLAESRDMLRELEREIGNRIFR